MLKFAMIDIDAQLQHSEFKTHLIVQVHDELLFDAPEDEIESLTELVKKAMIDGAKKAGLMRVPIEVEVGSGDNWLEAH
jgi:DNA polymerase I